MPTLCDVNVLLALVTDRHAHHTTAVRWLDSVAASEAVIFDRGFRRFPALPCQVLE